MRDEALAAPACIARLLAADEDRYAALASRLHEGPTEALLTLARGSSDHAAQHLAYLAMARLGQLVASLPPSLLTLHDSRLARPGRVALALSQSGQSPDLVEPLRTLRAGGACTVAIVNDTGSPLALAAEHLLPLHAGPERSVAATKSCLAQLVAGARLVAAWLARSTGDTALTAALPALPDSLAQAAALRWDAAVERLAPVPQLYVIGRGLGLAVAQEVALKFKETCGLHAEAVSGAELHHGPMALVGAGFPVLVLAPRGPAQAGMVALARQLHARGAAVLLAAPPGTAGASGAGAAVGLPLATAPHEDLDAIAALQTAYPMIEALAQARGHDPDAPPFLAKVTRTR